MNMDEKAMEEPNTPWYEQLDQLIAREGFSRSQVAQRAGISTKTITSWIRGDVQSPRDWMAIAGVLRVLQATTAEANRILEGAGHPPLHHLARRTNEAGRELLSPWLLPEKPFMAPGRLVTNLIGRQSELSMAVEAIRRQRRCVLFGMAGVGKTTLAIELANQVRDNYPDGVFWGDLRTGVADAVLESWGQACGVNLDRVTDFDSRAATMRTAFSRKKALIVLDDVVDSQIAQKMIPPQTFNCGVLITTRSEDVHNKLTHRRPELGVRLDPMSRRNSLALLESILGPERLREEKDAADVIAELLGDMPLALNICGALCTDAGLSLVEMVALLSDLKTRLEHLQLEDKPLVRLAFEQSWSLLDGTAQQALTALAVFEGRPFNAEDFAHITGLLGPQATLLLTKLCRRSLLSILKSDDAKKLRYQQHTLLAAFVAEKLDDNNRIWWRFSSYFASRIMQPDWWQTASSDLWANVMAAMAAAHRLNEWNMLLIYSNHLTEAWRRKGLYSLARQGYSLTIDAAQETADISAESAIRLAWGRACLEQSDYEPAREQLTAALHLYTRQEQNAGIAESHYHLSQVEMEQARHEAAENSIQKAYHAYQYEEDLQGMARALYRLGFIAFFRGDHERASRLVIDAIKSQHIAGDKIGLLRSHRLAVQANLLLGRFTEADRHSKVAAQLVDQVNDEAEQAAYFYVYADVLRKQKSFPAAHTYAHKALSLFREMSDGSSEINALLLLAGNEVNWNEAEPRRQQFDEGFRYCETADTICDAIGYEIGKGFALLMKGRLFAQKGENAKACASWAQALTIAKALEHEWLHKRLDSLINETRCA
jgi:tetratricopeptide (TPR) repeat protein/transcriptional regulator with XRE-family HTH domain